MEIVKTIGLMIGGGAVAWFSLLLYVYFRDENNKKTYYTDADKKFREKNPDYPPQVSAPMFYFEEGPSFPYKELLPAKVGDVVWWCDPTGENANYYRITHVPLLDSGKVNYKRPFSIQLKEGFPIFDVSADELISI